MTPKAPYNTFGSYAARRPTGCHAGRDGDCDWPECPQLRDDEPHRSGRHCPLDWLDCEEDGE